MRYPLTLSFDILMPLPPLSVYDTQNALIFTIVPKLLTFRPSFTAFSDPDQQQPLYIFTADRVLHFGVCYTITTTDGDVLGRVRRRPLRSIWRAQYEVTSPTLAALSVSEANPEDTLLNGCLRFIPLIRYFSGLVFHPAYLVRRADGRAIMRLEKRPDLIEGTFRIEKSGTQAEEERLALLSLFTILFIERGRG
jgi:hypothetical protein